MVTIILRSEADRRALEMATDRKWCGKCKGISHFVNGACIEHRCPDCGAKLVDAEIGDAPSDESRPGVMCGEECGYVEEL